MLVSCGAEGSVAVTQQFFGEFRFRFRVSAWRFKNQFEVALLSSAAFCSELGGVSWENYMHMQANDHRIPQSPNMQNGLKMGSRS